MNKWQEKWLVVCHHKWLVNDTLWECTKPRGHRGNHRGDVQFTADARRYKRWIAKVEEERIDNLRRRYPAATTEWWL